MNIEFTPFPKIARLSRDIVITEKLDGTNAAIRITEDGSILAQSRSRFITPENDNFGFARWVQQNASELLGLGEGLHFGEWWGSGIRRGYGLLKGEKRFSLFNTRRWKPLTPNYEGEPVFATAVFAPSCCSVVPVLYADVFSEGKILETMTSLQVLGSKATPFMNPEGVMIYHTAAGVYFKKTFEGDATGKEAA